MTKPHTIEGLRRRISRIDEGTEPSEGVNVPKMRRKLRNWANNEKARKGKR